MKYKNRLAFAYYSITFWDFKSFQSVPTTWQKLKAKNIFLKIDVQISKYRLLWFQIPISRYFQHCLVLKIPLSRPYFSQNPEYRTENLHFVSTGKNYGPSTFDKGRGVFYYFLYACFLFVQGFNHSRRMFIESLYYLQIFLMLGDNSKETFFVAMHSIWLQKACKFPRCVIFNEQWKMLHDVDRCSTWPRHL